MDEVKVEPKSWKIEVIADNSGKWCGNDMRYATKEKAREAAINLSSRWMLVREFRVEPDYERDPNER